MLRALRDAGIRPDLVVGSSAGALNAVAYAQDPTDEGLEALERLWACARFGEVFPLTPRSLLAGVTGRGAGLVTSRGLMSLIERGLRVQNLDQTRVPAHVIATDAMTGEPVVLSEGPAVQALTASASIPGILPPVGWRGRLLVDGSVSADVPVLQAEGLGATTTYVLPAAVPRREPALSARNAFHHLLRSVDFIMARATARDLAAAHGRVHVITPPFVSGLNPLDFRRATELIRLGHDSAQRWIEAAASTAMAAA